MPHESSRSSATCFRHVVQRWFSSTLHVTPCTVLQPCFKQCCSHHTCSCVPFRGCCSTLLTSPVHQPGKSNAVEMSPATPCFSPHMRATKGPGTSCTGTDTGVHGAAPCACWARAQQHRGIHQHQPAESSNKFSLNAQTLLLRTVQRTRLAHTAEQPHLQRHSVTRPRGFNVNVYLIPLTRRTRTAGDTHGMGLSWGTHHWGWADDTKRTRSVGVLNHLRGQHPSHTAATARPFELHMHHGHLLLVATGQRHWLARVQAASRTC
jgi:hypothetical protein